MRGMEVLFCLVIMGVRDYGRFLWDTLGCTGILLDIPWQACIQQLLPGALHFARGARTKLHRQYGAELGHDATPLAMSAVISCQVSCAKLHSMIRHDQLRELSDSQFSAFQNPKAC